MSENPTETSSNVYSYEEAFKECLDYFKDEELPAKVVVDKYLLVNEQNELVEKSPNDIHWRIANEFARIEKDKFKKPFSAKFIYSYLKNFSKIICQGSPTTAIGNNYQYTTASNCYVLESPLDSYGGIHNTDQQITQISKRRGGVGFDISHIRPKGMGTKNSSRTTTGIIPFMERFSNSIREVGQGGRRGAMMITISIHHPQVLDFANIKRDLTKVTGANISIRLSDDFLKALENNEDYEQRWPVDSKTPEINHKVSAKKVWMELISSAHAMAEPGILNWDHLIRESPADCYKEYGFETISTNPSLRGDTLVYIANKSEYIPIKELVDRDDLEVLNIHGYKCKFSCYQTGTNKQLFKITLSNGEVYCTAEHKWPVFHEDKLNASPEKFSTAELIEKIKTEKLYILWSHALFNKIVSVEPTDLYEDVYDITVFDDTHTFLTLYGYTGNCAELPLCKFDSCRLMILNTLSYVKLPFSHKAYFDFEEFYKDAQVLQRLMDDLIDIEIERIDRIIDKIKADPEPDHIKLPELRIWENVKKFCENGRRTGSGITALGDTIAALNIKYGSEDSIRFAEKLAQTLKFGCYRASVDMAKELGPFPVWRADLEKDNPFLNRMKDESVSGISGLEIWSDMQKYGRRNIALLTNAPTGTVSLLAQSFNSHGTSSGIEPVFMSSFKRRKKITHTDENARVDFVDQNGDKWQEFKVYHPALRAFMDLTGGREDESPYHEACANDIDWVNRVKLQAAIQKHIDHSISSTINLPEDISVEKVAEIYETAFKSGCKGMTIYRDKCRSGVLVEDKPNDHPKERPKEVECNVHHISVKGKKYVVLVGLVNDKPYEIFSVKNSLVKPKIKSGKIIKLWKSYYKAILEDGMEISPLTSNYDENEEAVTRLVSACLRTGGEILEVVHQLEKVNGDMTGFAKSVARALKNYIKDGTQTGETCPDCEQESIYYSEGCKKCSNCNYSKCG